MNGNYEDYLLREMTTDAGENDNDCDPKPLEVEDFGTWLEQHGDHLPLPQSFQEWLNQTQDSIDPESLDYSRGVKIIKDENGKLHFRPKI